MEKSSTYNYNVEPFTEDICGNLAWGNLGNLILRCASLHAGEHGFGYPQMIKLHHAWVLSRLVIEMESLPKTGEDFGIETWVDRLYRVYRPALQHHKARRHTLWPRHKHLGLD